jgi:hypothetical protein
MIRAPSLTTEKSASGRLPVAIQNLRVFPPAGLAKR